MSTETEKRKLARLEGKCTDCLKNEVCPGKNRCELCLDKRRTQAQKKREKLLNDGLCYKCGKEKFVPPSKICENCVNSTKVVREEKQYAKLRTQKKKDCGFCVSCGIKPARSGRVLCRPCAKKSALTGKKRRERFAADSRCTCCGESPLASKSFCKECLIKYRLAKKQSSNNLFYVGLCVRCRQPTNTTTNKQCKICIMKVIARKIWKDSSKWVDLSILFDNQKGLCPYIKEPIEIGENASIDHKIPLSRGGSNEIENLHWINYHVNMMKWILTHEEFLDLVGKIHKAALIGK